MYFRVLRGRCLTLSVIVSVSVSVYPLNSYHCGLLLLNSVNGCAESHLLGFYGAQSEVFAVESGVAHLTERVAKNGDEGSVG